MQINRLNFRALTLTLCAALFSLIACRKNAEEIVALLSESEAAEIAEAAVAERTAGATMPTVDMAEILASVPQTCDVPGDTSFQKSNSAGAASYNYTFNLAWLLDCSDLNVPQSASVDISGLGTFSNNNWTGNEQSTGQLTFTGLAPSATDYVVNGSYTLAGDLTGNLRRVDPTLNVTTEIALSGLTLRKSDYQITGGTGTLLMTATNGQGTSQTVNGTLVFNGNGTVTVTVNGHAHTFPI